MLPMKDGDDDGSNKHCTYASVLSSLDSERSVLHWPRRCLARCSSPNPQRPATAAMLVGRSLPPHSHAPPTQPSQIHLPPSNCHHTVHSAQLTLTIQLITLQEKFGRITWYSTLIFLLLIIIKITIIIIVPRHKLYCQLGYICFCLLLSLPLRVSVARVYVRDPLHLLGLQHVFQMSSVAVSETAKSELFVLIKNDLRSLLWNWVVEYHGGDTMQS